MLKPISKISFAEPSKHFFFFVWPIIHHNIPQENRKNISVSLETLCTFSITLLSMNKIIINRKLFYEFINSEVSLLSNPTEKTSCLWRNFLLTFSIKTSKSMDSLHSSSLSNEQFSFIRNKTKNCEAFGSPLIILFTFILIQKSLMISESLNGLICWDLPANQPSSNLSHRVND